MTSYVIAYDLVAPQADYDPLIKALLQISGRHVQDSAWIVSTEDPVQELVSYLRMYIEPTLDRLMIYPIADDGYESNSLQTED